MYGLTSSLNGKLALRQPPRERTRRKARLAISAGMPATEAILRLLMNDPLAAVNVLKRANDAYYGLRGSVGSLSHAVEIIGAESCLRELAEAQQSPMDRPAQLVLTRHASVTSQIAHRLANGYWMNDPQHGFKPGMVAGTGLFHNIGRLAFSVSLPLESDSLYGFSDSPFPISGSMSELEQLQFGINHAELGGFILHHLHFPREMQEAVRSHRCVGDEPCATYPSRLGWIVGASCLLAEAAGYGLDPQVSLGHEELDTWLNAFDGHVTFIPGDLDAILRELSESDRLFFDDDPWFDPPEQDDSTPPRSESTSTDRPAVPSGSAHTSLSSTAAVHRD
jgi:HD-like signal output (HDOD) protein